MLSLFLGQAWEPLTKFDTCSMDVQSFHYSSFGQVGYDPLTDEDSHLTW